MYLPSNLPRRSLRRARELTLGRFYIDLGDYRRTVILAGTGRSGTTWVANVLNHANAYRLMFEPFYPREVPQLSGFRERQYLRPGDSDPRYVEPVRRLLSGRVRSRWIDRPNRRLVVTQRLIKDIRAHFLLGWIRRHFPEIPIILLLRHPCAVAHSKSRLSWDSAVDGFLDQPELKEDFFEGLAEETLRVGSAFERYVLMWCLENYVPLKQFPADEIHILFYEHLCTRPEREIDRLFGFLGTAWTERVFRALRRPSPVTRRESAVVTGGDPLTEWTRGVGAAQVSRALEILTAFGMDAIYGEGPEPLVDGGTNPLAGPAAAPPLSSSSR